MPRAAARVARESARRPARRTHPERGAADVGLIAVDAFADRADAGRRLAQLVRREGYGADAVVVGLPRGGVPVAFEVARELGAALDLVAVRKLGVPYQPELAMGAIGEDGVLVRNEPVLRRLRLRPADLDDAEQRESPRLRELAALRAGRARVPLAGRVVIVVDDGVATGSTAHAACDVVRAQGAESVALAAPVAPPEVYARFRDTADAVICVFTPESFLGVGQFYVDFAPTSDAEVTRLLHASRSS